MSYSRPSSSAVNESWSGAYPYSRQASSVVNESFAPSGAYPAYGFKPINLGTPVLWYTASTLRPVNFGTPRLVTAYAVASGFKPANLGTPVLWYTATALRAAKPGILSMYQTAAGFKPTKFGTPKGMSVFALAPLRPMNFGTPSTPVVQTFTASGYLATRFSTPIVVRMQPKRRTLLCHVVSLRPVKLGKHAAY